MTGDPSSQSDWLGWTKEMREMFTDSLQRSHRSQREDVFSEEDTTTSPDLFSE